MTTLPKTERGLLVAAVRQLLADGWRLRLMESRDALTALHYDEIGMDAVPMIVIHDRLRGVQHKVFPESIAQARTFLAAAKVLPRRFAFWVPPLPSRPMHDENTCTVCRVPFNPVTVPPIDVLWPEPESNVRHTDKAVTS